MVMDTPLPYSWLRWVFVAIRAFFFDFVSSVAFAEPRPALRAALFK